MSQPPSQPQLTPQLCFSTTALKEFFRTSRGSIDDSIVQNLNALATPADAGFDPSSTSQRGAGPGRRQLDPRSCQDFKLRVLFPSWHARKQVLSYCAVVATSPDPDDPDVALRRTEDEAQREKTVDERLDPYSARYFPREPRTERLAAFIRQERGVESIVRARTWEVVKERCGASDDDWQVAFGKWRASNGDMADSQGRRAS